MKSSAILAGIISLTCSISSALAEDNPQRQISAFEANYSILHNAKPVGKATRKLEYTSNNKANFSYETKIKWLIFSDHRVEESSVSIEKDKVTPVQYHYLREGTGRDKEEKWQYNVEEKTATNLLTEDVKKVDWPVGLQDSLSYHLQNRINLKNNPEQKSFVYPVIRRDGRIKNYVFEYAGEEDLMLPYGVVKAIKLKREVIEKKRITYAWFAPELDYLLVKLYQVKSGAEQFEAQLTSINAEK